MNKKYFYNYSRFVDLLRKKKHNELLSEKERLEFNSYYSDLSTFLLWQEKSNFIKLVEDLLSINIDNIDINSEIDNEFDEFDYELSCLWARFEKLRFSLIQNYSELKKIKVKTKLEMKKFSEFFTEILNYLEFRSDSDNELDIQIILMIKDAYINFKNKL